MSTTITAVRKHTSHRYTLEAEVDGESVELETTHQPADHVAPLLHKLPNGGWVVGYLCHDDDCGNPLQDCDGMGSIFTCHRHASRESHEGYRQAIGLDSDWNRVRDRDPMAVVLDCYDHGGEVYAIQGSAQARHFPDQQWDVGHGVAVWVPDACCEESIWYKALASFLPKEVVDIGYKSQEPYGKDGKGYLNRIMVSVKARPSLEAVQTYNSRVKKTKLPEFVTLRPQGYKSFKTAAQAALRFFGIKPVPEEIARRVRGVTVEMAEGVLETYNAWLSGDCWGVCIDVLDADLAIVEDDACWGHIGDKYARETLQAEFEAVVDRHEEDKKADAGV